MIKRIAVAMALVAGNAYGAMDCGLYYTYGTAKYAECQDRNSNEASQRAQANIDRFTNQVNTIEAQERQAAQQADADIQLQQALRQIQEAQNQR